MTAGAQGSNDPDRRSLACIGHIEALALGRYQHMGTTRMFPTPNRGVVDEDCRVHGVENLYIAGSSVFPTGGWANPTLTILALGIRLADRVRRVA
jgi:choline dehydrogenase-like flavoprotein